MPEGTVIVTGASRGIGAAIAGALVAADYPVVALSRSGAAEHGDGLACDVTDEADIRRVVARIAARGPIAGLVNNAGAHEASPTAELTAARFEALMRLNTTSVLSFSREAYPHLAARGGGLIVNMGSFLDRMGVSRNAAYCASKAAVAALTRCMAAEWARDGVRVLAIAPGYIATDMNRDFLASEKNAAWLARRVPVGRPGKPEEVGRLVAALFTSGIGFLTGETIYIDGGQGHNL